MTPSGGGRTTGGRRLSTETKASFKTSELVAYVVVFILILIAGNSIESDAGSPDQFRADEVWLYITILTVGYMVSRGLAKSGSRDPYWEDSGQNQARETARTAGRTLKMSFAGPHRS